MSKINILIPMAGLGSRFSQAGFSKPKPFIDVHGMPMIERVMNNINIPNAHYILVAQESHLSTESEYIISLKKNFNITVVPVNGLTEGTACTILFARHLINDQTPLLIANSDQIVDISLAKFVEDCDLRSFDGSILCFEDLEKNPKWSFARINETNGLVCEVKEKVPISTLATVGIYYFKMGSDFVDNAITMIIKNDRVNGEFYTCPVYNYLIERGKKITSFIIRQNEMHGLGTPEDLSIYLHANEK